MDYRDCERCGKNKVPVLTPGGRMSKALLCRSCTVAQCPSQTPEARRANGYQRQRAKEYYSTPVGKAHRAWNNLLKRVRLQPSYSQVKVLISKEEFVEWFLEQLESWEQEHPDEKPSVDRVKDDGHYELDNLQFLEVQENRIKNSHVKNLGGKAPEGTKWCPRCKGYIVKEGFYTSNGEKLSTYCKVCTRLPVSSGKCEDCSKELPLTKSGRVSRQKNCDACRQRAYQARKRQKRNRQQATALA